MEELFILHFMNLGKRVKEYAQTTGCSNQVAEWALHSQLFLDEMKREHLGWNATHRQEWNLFLLEQMFHNATAMWHKKHQRCSHRLPLEPEPSEVDVKLPDMWALVGAKDTNLLQVAEWIYKSE